MQVSLKLIQRLIHIYLTNCMIIFSSLFTRPSVYLSFHWVHCTYWAKFGEIWVGDCGRVPHSCTIRLSVEIGFLVLRAREERERGGETGMVELDRVGFFPFKSYLGKTARYRWTDRRTYDNIVNRQRTRVVRGCFDYSVMLWYCDTMSFGNALVNSGVRGWASQTLLRSYL